MQMHCKDRGVFAQIPHYTGQNVLFRNVQELGESSFLSHY